MRYVVVSYVADITNVWIAVVLLLSYVICHLCRYKSAWFWSPVCTVVVTTFTYFFQLASM